MGCIRPVSPKNGPAYYRYFRMRSNSNNTPKTPVEGKNTKSCEICFIQNDFLVREFLYFFFMFSHRKKFSKPNVVSIFASHGSQPPAPPNSMLLKTSRKRRPHRESPRGSGRSALRQHVPNIELGVRGDRGWSFIDSCCFSILKDRSQKFPKSSDPYDCAIAPWNERNVRTQISKIVNFGYFLDCSAVPVVLCTSFRYVLVKIQDGATLGCMTVTTPTYPTH